MGSPACEDCKHPLNPHVVVATTGDPLDGGLMFCPECPCVMTWGIKGVSSDDCKVMPPPHVVEEVRAAVFGKAEGGDGEGS